MHERGQTAKELSDLEDGLGVKTTKKMPATPSKSKPHRGKTAAAVRGDAELAYQYAPQPQCCGLYMDTFCQAEYIGEDAIHNLDHYAYHGTDLSFMAEYVLTAFWNWCMRFIPLWMAPNLVTTLGFICNIIAFLLVVIYEQPAFEGEAPRWVYWSIGILFFIYQTMDNCDGRQARRTGTSSPLGEMFDHICDASSVAIFLMSTGGATGLGVWWTWLIVWLGYMPFHSIHWEEYYVGELVMGRFNGPTEMLLGFIVINFAAGAVGPYAFHIDSPIAGWSWLHLAIVGASVGVCGTLLQHTLSVRKHCAEHGLSFGAALIDLTPFFIFVGAYALWTYASYAYSLTTGEKSVLEKHPYLFILSSQFVFSYLETRLIVQRMCKQHCPVFYLILLLPLIGALNSTAGWLNGDVWFDESKTMEVVFAFTCANTAWLLASVCNQLSSYLKIKVFKIPY